ncbi:MAG: hypothetical protein U0746_11070 [Gemmataceae bacterium]
MRLAIPLFVAFTVTTGCALKAPTTPVTATATATAAKPDLRTWTRDEVETFLCSKYRDDSVKLTAGASGKYTGTRRSPDGTATMPLTVTVEADRVICEVKAPGMTMHDVVPFEGEIKSNLVER